MSVEEGLRARATTSVVGRDMGHVLDLGTPEAAQSRNCGLPSYDGISMTDKAPMFAKAKIFNSTDNNDKTEENKLSWT